MPQDRPLEQKLLIMEEIGCPGCTYSLPSFPPCFSNPKCLKECPKINCTRGTHGLVEETVATSHKNRQCIFHMTTVKNVYKTEDFGPEAVLARRSSNRFCYVPIDNSEQRIDHSFPKNYRNAPSSDLLVF